MIYLGSTPEVLAQATLRARGGEAASVLEPSSRLGGWAATQELWPDIEVPLETHHAGNLSQRLIDDLRLVEEHGLAFLDPPALAHAPAPDGQTPSLTIWRQMDRTVEEIGRHSPQDAARWPDFCRQAHRHAGLLDELLQLDLAALVKQGLDAFGAGADQAAAGSEGGRQAVLSAHEGGRPTQAMLQATKSLLGGAAWNELAPALRLAVRLRRQGGPEMMEFLRVLPMTFKELMDEWFETPLLRGLLGSSAVLNSHLGPQAAGTTLNFLFHLIGSPDGQFRNICRVRGGLPALMQALESAARSAGVEITLNADIRAYFEDDLASDQNEPSSPARETARKAEASPPARLDTLSASKAGNRSSQGTSKLRDSASAWTSAYLPHHTYLELLPPSHLTPELLRRLRPQAPRPVTTYLHILLEDPSLPADAESGHIVLAPSLEYIERAADAHKYDRPSENLIIDAFRTHDQVLTLRLQYTHPDQPLSDLITQALEASPIDPAQVQSTNVHPASPIYTSQSLDLDQLVQRAFH
ncbi:MAG TPA: hypothetical protein VLV83_11370 [Acidobacteriota bacterium]|nr:hypothetical protein [Acidobacteriota bacterium]